MFTVIAIVMLGACSSSSKPKVTPSTAPISPVTSTSTTVAPAGTTTKAPTTKPNTTSTAAPHGATAAQLASAHIKLQTVVTGLSSPVGIIFRPGTNQMYVVQQTGTLRLIQNGKASATPAVDLRANLSNGNEQGFLDAAFSPNGKKLFVSYTDAKGNTNIDAYTMRGTTADPSTRRRVFFAQQPYANHNGGDITFGPDGMLYIGLGDGGSENDPDHYGQNLATPLSKILRINPAPQGNASYTVPADNPYVGKKGALPETWMWGLRNPWRFSFDRATGDTWIGDVGQNLYEEIDYAPRGEAGINWGWSAREGFHPFHGNAASQVRDPIVEEPHSAGWCAIVGGYVYRGRAIPALDGVYLYGDNCHSGVEGLVQRAGHEIAKRDLGVQVDSLTSFGQDDNGELYIAARGGTVYKVVSG
jgi:glucose/arabinose dehydrogenase